MTYKKPVLKKCNNCGTYSNLILHERKYSCELCARKPQLPPDENWVAGAACRKTTLDFFSEEKIDIYMAKLICGDCPVKNICLNEAISRKERHGVWGGTSEEDRSAIFRRMKITT